jgi:hypothetical protein
MNSSFKIPTMKRRRSSMEALKDLAKYLTGNDSQKDSEREFHRRLDKLDAK